MMAKVDACREIAWHEKMKTDLGIADALECDVAMAREIVDALFRARSKVERTRRTMSRDGSRHQAGDRARTPQGGWTWPHRRGCRVGGKPAGFRVSDEAP